ncbi:SRPBCC family protein [Streptacidiphilus sp. EB129]|uniref:SRPBCC family protein n=1 Tax=Streptacidiphilus sp. EB129 TaxID=3156262 RepID=UPI003510EDA5
MTTLEEQIDVAVPAKVAWDQLHRVGEYPKFIDGVTHAHAHGRHHACLDLEIDGNEQAVEADIFDRGRGRLMSLQTVSGPPLKATLALLPRDRQHTTVQIRLEYDPATIKETLGGPRGFAQASAIERTVREDLQHFKTLVEGDRA